MRRVLMTALTGAAAAAAVPAYADPGPVVDPCSAIYVNGAIACQGYYGSNLITGTTGQATSTDVQNILFALLNGTASTADSSPTNNTTDYHPPYSLDYDMILGSITGLNGSATMNFGSLNLSGLTILGAHFGNNIDSDQNNVTAFWLLDLGSTTTHTITLSDGQGSSNAQIFATSGAVPEPATWAMMLLGFGGIGMAMRRSRKANGRLLQVA